jgi:hypothetical protein
LVAQFTGNASRIALQETFMATQDIQGKEETKLANGGGAFPFWVSVVIVAGFFAILFGIVYGIVQLFV